MFTNNIFQKRANKLQNKIEKGQSILLSSPGDVTYFTNFEFLVPEEREAFVFITKKSINLIHTSFAPIDNFAHLNYLSGSFPSELAIHLEKIIKSENIDTLLIDDKTLFVAEINEIKNKIKNIKNYDHDLIESIRNIKDETEIEKIKKACSITSLVMRELKRSLYVGITELETKKLINKLFEKHGSTQLAFPIIVAFGSNSALPHHQPGNKSLEDNMVVLVDIGTKFSGYCSDMTRTFWFGDNPSKKFLEIEKIVHDAYQAAFDKLKNVENTKIIAKDIDDAARTLISSHGYANNFIHTTGHGLGLSIHEQPSISWANYAELYPGMTITIEPGIYIEGEFGIRYENTILIAKNGIDELTN